VSQVPNVGVRRGPLATWLWLGVAKTNVGDLARDRTLVRTAVARGSVVARSPIVGDGEDVLSLTWCRLESRASSKRVRASSKRVRPRSVAPRSGDVALDNDESGEVGERTCGSDVARGSARADSWKMRL
jgi:hypothetical protein